MIIKYDASSKIFELLENILENDINNYDKIYNFLLNIT